MKTVFFTIADEVNEKWAKGLERSFKRFHPDVDFRIFGPKYVAGALKQDPEFFYKATPWIARGLFKNYSLVVKVDADSVIGGTLDHILQDKSYDLGTVLNFNQVDARQFGAVSVWDIAPDQYMNCGLVAMRSKEFLDHWWKLCNAPSFRNYRYREQDMMNILYHYGNYKVRCFDDENTLNGLASKDFWLGVELKDERLVLPIVDNDGKLIKEVDIKVLHWAEGHNPQKMNFDLRFRPEVARYLKDLTKYEVA